MPKGMSYKSGSSTGKYAGDHKGGKGDMRGYTKPGYPKGEMAGKTVASPNYPRSNFATSKGRGSDSVKGMGGKY